MIHFLTGIVLALACAWNPFLNLLRRNPLRYWLNCAVRFGLIAGLGCLLSYLVLPAFTGPLWGSTLVFMIMGGWLVNAVYSIVEYCCSGQAVYDTPFPRAALTLVVIGLMCPTAIAFFYSSFFKADEYSRLLGEVELTTWEDYLSPVDASHMRMVSGEMARWKADKVLGESSDAIGSRFEIGQGTIQDVKGELWWVFPLEFRGFSKWWSQEVTPGFVMVSAEDWRKNARLEQGYKMKYMPSARFGSDLHRYLYSRGYATYQLVDFTFEVDDLMQPKWVVTLVRPTIGYWGQIVLGVVIIDPQTGDVDRYGIEDVPTWVDRVYPEEIVINYLTYYGQYRDGWWNSFWSQVGVVEPTSYPDGGEGLSGRHACLVFTGDGRKAWFTGMTSASAADQSLTSVAFIDSRTGQAQICTVKGGINEEAVIDTVNGKVSNYEGWGATAPVPYNVDGNLTYTVPVLNQAGIYQKLAFANHTGTVVGLGDTKTTALRAYRRTAATNSNLVAPAQQVNAQSLEAKLTRVSSSVQDGETVYYLYTADYPHKVFVASNTLSAELPLAQVGDNVVMKFMDSSEEVLSLRSFDLTEIDLRKSVGQLALEDRYQEQQVEQDEKEEVRWVMQLMDQVPEEELRQMLNSEENFLVLLKEWHNSRQK